MIHTKKMICFLVDTMQFETIQNS